MVIFLITKSFKSCLLTLQTYAYNVQIRPLLKYTYENKLLDYRTM